MDQIARNLMSFRMDHDYTPLTSPKHQSSGDDPEIDELAQTLSILEGNVPEDDSRVVKVVKTPKIVKKPLQIQTKPKAKMINTVSIVPSKQQHQPKTVSTPKTPTTRIVEQVDSDSFDDEDFDDVDFEEDDNDSDFELEETPKVKAIKKPRGRRSKKLQENTLKPRIKTLVAKQIKTEQETPKLEKAVLESKQVEVKQPEKKTPPKKEKKVIKPPDDFALFSTPDIIRRVGGKEATTPTTPVTPEFPKTPKPAKIHHEARSKSSDSIKSKRVSTENRGRLSIEEGHSKRLSTDKLKVKTEKIHDTDKKVEGTVSVQGYDESVGSNSSESILESQLEPLPSAEDIRAIIQNENTKTFTSSLVIPDSHDTAQTTESNNQTNIEANSLDLDQSILDNINTDLISEDILYQVAQSLVDSPELQNVIDKSIVDGNLMLDPSLQTINQEHTAHHTQSINTQVKYFLMYRITKLIKLLHQSDFFYYNLPCVHIPHCN